MPYRCREEECAKRLGAKTRPVMEGSKLGFQTRMIAMYLVSMSLNHAASIELHHDLKTNRRNA